mmetsp:Transcript_34669/g.101911  ORF Transcript_34669/g.101911 Transcript_34669/m.101911 type:complete len:317 (+) Transcript_34669:476-1426(+)
MEDEPHVARGGVQGVDIGGDDVLEDHVGGRGEGTVGEVLLSDHTDADVGGALWKGPDGVAVVAAPEVGGRVGEVVRERGLGEVDRGHHGGGENHGRAGAVAVPAGGLGLLLVAELAVAGHHGGHAVVGLCLALSARRGHRAARRRTIGAGSSRIDVGLGGDHPPLVRTGDGIHGHAAHAGGHAAHDGHGRRDAELPVGALPAERIAGGQADLTLDADPRGLEVAGIALRGEDGDLALVGLAGRRGLLLVAAQFALLLLMGILLMAGIDIGLLLVSGSLLLIRLSSDSALLGIGGSSGDGQKGRQGDGLELHALLSK